MQLNICDNIIMVIKQRAIYLIRLFYLKRGSSGYKYPGVAITMTTRWTFISRQNTNKHIVWSVSPAYALGTCALYVTCLSKGVDVCVSVWMYAASPFCCQNTILWNNNNVRMKYKLYFSMCVFKHGNKSYTIEKSLQFHWEADVANLQTSFNNYSIYFCQKNVFVPLIRVACFAYCFLITIFLQKLSNHKIVGMRKTYIL